MNKIKEVLLSSPIRKNINNNIPFKTLVSKNLDEIMGSIDILYKKGNKPLNIVVIGEVKSGKSSFVNALLSKEVSEVDVLEATSSIIEIGYGKEEKRKNVDGVDKVFLNKDYLKKVNIIDTPGLKSITLKNEQKTLDYIQNSDLILFIFDSTHLGQEDIEEVLDIISTYKKKIIGIINKADLLEDDKDQVMEYAKEEYGIYIEEFFMISAHLEYQYRISKGALAGNTDLVISNYDDLKENFKRLDEHIENLINNCDVVKDSSIKSSMEGIIHKEIIYHHDYSKSISILADELKKYEELIMKKSEYINDKIDFEISDWINRTFFNDEVSKISDNIEVAKIYINEGYINDAVNRKKKNLDTVYFNEWSECLKELDEEINQDIKQFLTNKEYKKVILNTPNIKIEDQKINLNDLLATLGTGAILGATSGGIISAYASGIGTSAASLTIGKALLSYCPPLLIAGTLTGGIGKLLYDKVKMEQKNNEVVSKIKVFVEQLKLDTAESLSSGYKNANKDIIDNSKEEFKLNKGIYMNIYEIISLSEEIDMYINSLKKYITK